VLVYEPAPKRTALLIIDAQRDRQHPARVDPQDLGRRLPDRDRPDDSVLLGDDDRHGHDLHYRMVFVVDANAGPDLPDVGFGDVPHADARRVIATSLAGGIAT
jgi:hypothetical protein